MENQFDMGLNVASIETELPDPVITLSGADSFTVSDTAEMPLLKLTAYGRSWQDERIVNIADIGIEGYGIPVLTGSGNYTDSNGQEWVCDELIVNADGTGKVVKHIASVTLDGSEDENIISGTNGENFTSFGVLDVPVPLPYTSNILCNITDAYNMGYSTVDNFTVHIGNALNILFGNNLQIATVGDVKQWLGEHPADVIYELKDPTENELTAEQISLLQPLIKKHGTFTAYFMSTQSGVPTYENPVDIVSTADLHRISIPIESIGDSGSLAVTTCGKNLIKYPYYSGTSHTAGGITFTVNDDKSITVSGTSTTYPTFFLTGEKGAEVFYPEGIYIMRGSGMTNCSVMFTYYDYSKNKYVDLCYANIYDQVITIPEGGIKAWVQIQVHKGSTVNGVIYPQLEKGNILTDYEPYKSTTASITTGLPLRGIPVSSGGNHTDSNGQEWICDTLEHVYGEPAQVVKRVKKASVKALFEMKEGSTAYIKDYIGYGDNMYTWLKNARFVWRDDIASPCWYLQGTGVWHKYIRDSFGGDGHLWYDTAWTDTYFTEYDPSSMRIVAGVWKVRQTTYNGLPLPDPLPALPVTVPAFELSTGDAVPDEYISTVGDIREGAEIIYPSETEEIILTTKETEGLSALSSFKGSTTVYNENTAEMTIKLLREDFEMQYIHWIKETQSFICEKSGKYKIICVGGGSSGGVGVCGAQNTLQAVGTTTSFGNIISASGGGRTRTAVDSNFGVDAIVGGQSGYDGINYGSTSHVLTKNMYATSGDNNSVMWGIGHGYGAGGGARGIRIRYTKPGTEGSTSADLLSAGGQCGKVESTIVDLEENQTVFCTIGGGGVLNLSDQDLIDYIANNLDSEATGTTETGADVSTCVSDGADGVIIVQYLGV